VHAIAAPAGLRVVIEGEGEHAGTVLMHERHDALTAAAEVVLAVEHTARNSGSADSVATVGICQVYPRASNSIPGRVQLSVDVRDTDRDARDGMIATIRQEVERIGRARQVQAQVEVLHTDMPVKSHDDITQAATAAAEVLGLAHLPMVSRAYHDTTRL
jgi:N-carbamoyl-L-amino-acid hydrolase